MKARKVVSDQNSAELDQLRRTVNNLLRIIEGWSASNTAGATAINILQATADAVTAGVDSNPNSVASVVATHCALEGCKPQPTVPKQARGPLVTSTQSDTY